MDFANDIFTLEPPTKQTFKLEGTALPTNKDLYFRTKQREIIDQYAAARIFLNETEIEDWSHWFNQVDDERNNTAFKKIFTTYFYETALMYYNIVTELQRFDDEQLFPYVKSLLEELERVVKPSPMVM